LIGNNGVDFVISDDGPFAIEVNPRIQGSLDSVEFSTGLNIVDASVNAVRGGVLPERVVADRYAVRAIAFAKQDGVVVENLDIRWIVDIPEKSRVIKQGEPIATAIGIGDSRESAVADAMEKNAHIRAGVRYG
jgi:predicted ATP-grasp superfamily ATP-dependent carboligase